MEADEADQKARMNEEQGQELEYAQEHMQLQRTVNDLQKSGQQKQINISEEDSLIDRELKAVYSAEQKEALRQALAKKIAMRELLDYYHPDVTAEEMRRAWNL